MISEDHVLGTSCPELEHHGAIYAGERERRAIATALHSTIVVYSDPD
ncbi:MAG: hypothetical protein KAS72_02570 [Phycisphaerales bacterium]|nr:hypothetical protein [Phycisphaerales bacterium]